MASAWRKKNARGRRMVALENLKSAKFFPKVIAPKRSGKRIDNNRLRCLKREFDERV